MTFEFYGAHARHAPEARPQVELDGNAPSLVFTLPMVRRFCGFGLGVVMLSWLGCQCHDEDPVKRDALRNAPSSDFRDATAPSATGNAQVHPALRGAHYRHDAVTPLPDDCRDPVATLDEAPPARAASPTTFTVARQVLSANPQFQVVDELRGPRGHIVLLSAVREPSKNIVLLARCSDATTCNVLAAAYKSIVPTSQPQLSCGNPRDVGAIRPASVVDPKKPLSSALPAPHDTAGQCARLAACQAARDGRLRGDPIADCQKKPRNYRLECAHLQPCAAVLACLDAAH